MTACNRCQGSMVPAAHAIVPALECVDCGRLIPRTFTAPVKDSRQQTARALRAARRRKLATQ